jgi:hypothetical protein
VAVVLGQFFRPPHLHIFAQSLESVECILDGVVFLGSATVVKRELSLPFI